MRPPTQDITSRFHLNPIHLFTFQRNKTHSLIKNATKYHFRDCLLSFSGEFFRFQKQNIRWESLGQPKTTFQRNYGSFGFLWMVSPGERFLFFFLSIRLIKSENRHEELVRETYVGALNWLGMKLNRFINLPLCVCQLLRQLSSSDVGIGP